MSDDPLELPVQVLGQGKYLRLLVRGTWEYTERVGVSGIVGIVPVTDARELVMVEQLRMPLGRRVVELPAGLAGDIEGQRDEAMESAAARELEEETGYRAGRLRRLMEGPNAAGSSNSQMTFFLADQLVKVGDGGGDEHEDITVHVVPMDGIWPWLQAKQAAGLALDPKIFAGLWFAEHLL